MTDETRPLAIEEYQGYAVTLFPLSGMFHTTTGEDSYITTATLREMRERLQALHVKMQQAHREAQPPARVALYCQRPKSRTTELEILEVKGIVPNRSYPPIVKTASGQRAIGSENAHVLHPDDPRIPILQGHIASIARASTALDEARAALHASLSSVPGIRVPKVATKEEALDKEPAFLAALRAIVPGQTR